MRYLLLLLVVATAALAAPPKAQRVVPATDLLIRQGSPVLDWRWRMVPEAATQPALLATMRGEALKQADKERRNAARDAAESEKNGFPFRRYETISDWSLAADTPRLLALAGETYAYTGGAHGNTGYSIIIWDKAAKRRLTFADLFTDWPRARKLLEPAYCRTLALEQKQRRGGAGGDAAPDACPRLAEQPTVPYARLGAVARQFRVLIAPYLAGSYAEGSYLIDAPWPDGVADLIKPQYRADLMGTR